MCVGYTGSVHESGVLKNSPLYIEKQYPPPGYRLIRDGGYPCLSYPNDPDDPLPSASQEPAAGSVQQPAGPSSGGGIRCTILHNICLSQGDMMDHEDGKDGNDVVAGASEEEDLGRVSAPPGTVSGAEERNTLTLTLTHYI